MDNKGESEQKDWYMDWQVNILGKAIATMIMTLILSMGNIVMIFHQLEIFWLLVVDDKDWISIFKIKIMNSIFMWWKHKIEIRNDEKIFAD